MDSFDRLKAKYKNRDLADDYRKRFQVGGRKRSTAFILRALKKAIGPGEKSILDVPAGTGRFSFPMREAGHFVVGADYSVEMLAQTQKDQKETAIPFLRADIRSLPFADNSFDVVTCIRLFHLIRPEDRIKAMVELRRVAREKVVLVYYPRHTIKQLTRWIRWKLRLTAEPRTRFLPWRKVREEIEAAGMKVAGLFPACLWFIDDWIVETR